MGEDNLAFGSLDIRLSYNVQQPNVNSDPGGHFLTPDNANERPDNLPFSGAIVSQSEVFVNFLLFTDPCNENMGRANFRCYAV